MALNTVQEFTGTAKVPDRLAVYDAAVNIDGSIDTAWLDGFEDAVNGGKVGHALAHMKKATSPGYKETAERLHQAVPGSTYQLSPKCFHGSIPAAVKELVTDIAAYFTGGHPDGGTRPDAAGTIPARRG